MPARGQVYFLPKKIIPPGQANNHSVVVLSKTHLIATSGNQLFVVAAMIRSAVNRQGLPVRHVIGHSIPLPANTIASHQSQSIVETHQLFSIRLDDFHGQRPQGTLPKPILADVLAGARLLLS